MKITHTLGASVLGLSLVLAHSASAALVTVEPDDFAAGTNISSAVAGVTLSVVSTSPSFGFTPPNNSVYAEANTVGGPAATGSLVFATSQSGSFGQSWFTGDHIFRADFSAATSFVSIMTTSDGIADTDVALFQIFDSSNALLDSLTIIADNTVQTATFLRGTADISYLIVSNPVGSEGDSFLLDKLTFESGAGSVPDNASVAVWGIALAGLGLMRRKRNS